MGHQQNCFPAYRNSNKTYSLLNFYLIFVMMTAPELMYVLFTNYTFIRKTIKFIRTSRNIMQIFRQILQINIVHNTWVNRKAAMSLLVMSESIEGQTDMQWEWFLYFTLTRTYKRLKTGSPNKWPLITLCMHGICACCSMQNATV